MIISISIIIIGTAISYVLTDVKTKDQTRQILQHISFNNISNEIYYETSNENNKLSIEDCKTMITKALDHLNEFISETELHENLEHFSRIKGISFTHTLENTLNILFPKSTKKPHERRTCDPRDDKSYNDKSTQERIMYSIDHLKKDHRYI